MPIESIRRIAAAATEVRQRWTHEERLRRAHMADTMQARLLSLAGLNLVPAYAKFPGETSAK